MTSADHLSDEERRSIEHDRDLAWELSEFQPDHPQIPVLARSVLAREPSFTGQIILLAKYHEARGEVDTARELLQDLLGRRDRQYVNALRELCELEQSARNWAESARLAELVLREDPEPGWRDYLLLAYAQVFTVAPEVGWDGVDAAVAHSARHDPDDYDFALGQRATVFLATGAPPERFLPAAEAALAADPTQILLSLTLGYAYIYDYRWAEAETLFRGVLREDPTEELAVTALTLVQAFQAPVEQGLATMDQLRAIGIGEMAWGTLRSEMFDTTLRDALSALNDLLPVEVTATLRPPLDADVVAESGGEPTLLSWHDGQVPNDIAFESPHGRFRIMSNAEILEMNADIEANPDTWAWFQDREEEYFDQIFTDDRGGYVLEGFARRLILRTPHRPDEVIAPSLAEWFWDRVVDFGGADPRPGARIR